MADSKVTALTEVSAPALTDVTYWVADPGGSPAQYKITSTRLGGLFVVGQCQGRLTTESGVPVSTSDRTSQGTIYWTPCTPAGVATATGLVGFYDGTRYVIKSLSELSLALTVTSGKNYDVFLDYNSGTPQLVLSAAWTNDTTRADALATQGPFVVKSGSATLRWVGTIGASGSNVTADAETARYVWNAYNQTPRQALSASTYASDATTSSTSLATLSSNLQLSVVVGAAQWCFTLLSASLASTGSNIQDSQVAIMLNGTDYKTWALPNDTTPSAALPLNFVQTFTASVPVVAGLNTMDLRWAFGAGSGALTYLGASRGSAAPCTYLQAQVWG